MPVPTVEDLRVKLCYVCREEETYDKPSSPPRRWVHPCKCTLIAHEACLLEWIKTAETNPSKTSSDILKCPQCGAVYELDSQNPLILRIMRVADKTITIISRGVTIMSVGAIVASFGAGIYMLCTAYGAFAIQQFIGDELFDMFLSDDPSKWPLHSWVNLPLIPLSLVLGQTTMFKHTLPLIPLAFFWPSVPISVSRPPIDFYPDIVTEKDATFISLTSPAVKPIFSSWPPSPLAFGIATTVLGPYYTHYFNLFRRWILDLPEDGDDLRGRPIVRRLMLEGWHMEMRVEGDLLDDNGARAGPAAAGVRQNDINNIGENDRGHNVVGNAVADQPNVDGEGHDAAGEGADPEVNVPLLENELDDGPLPPGPGALPAGAAGAEAQEAAQAGRERDAQTIRITGADIGRVIGGALLIPPISNLIGNALFRLSRYSPILRRFLGIRNPVYLGPTSYYIKNNIPMSLTHRLLASASFAVSNISAGSPAWRNADPVWWRNSLGYGIWIVACDMVSLCNEWLSKREVESRKLRNRPFNEVDPAELDLINVTNTSDNS